MKRIEREVEDAFDDVENRVDIFDDKIRYTRRRARQINRRVDRMTDDVDDWFD